MRLRLSFFLLLVATSAAFIAPLGAHTEVWQRSPDMGLEYGGTVDRVQISFFATVESSKITLADADGTPIEVGPTTLERGDRVAVAEFAALTEAGAYIVTHTELASDGDIQTDAYQFFFNPESDNEVISLVDTDEGPNWVLLGVISGVVLILAGMFWPGRTERHATPS